MISLNPSWDSVSPAKELRNYHAKKGNANTYYRNAIQISERKPLSPYARGSAHLPARAEHSPPVNKSPSRQPRRQRWSPLSTPNLLLTPQHPTKSSSSESRAGIKSGGTGEEQRRLHSPEGTAQSKKRHSSGGEPLEPWRDSSERGGGARTAAAGLGYGRLGGGSSVNHGAVASGSGTGMELREECRVSVRRLALVKACKAAELGPIPLGNF
jgi:hypothetical protein